MDKYISFLESFDYNWDAIFDHFSLDDEEIVIVLDDNYLIDVDNYLIQQGLDDGSAEEEEEESYS